MHFSTTLNLQNFTLFTFAFRDEMQNEIAGIIECRKSMIKHKIISAKHPIYSPARVTSGF